MHTAVHTGSGCWESPQPGSLVVRVCYWFQFLPSKAYPSTRVWFDRRLETRLSKTPGTPPGITYRLGVTSPQPRPRVSTNPNSWPRMNQPETSPRDLCSGEHEIPARESHSNSTNQQSIRPSWRQADIGWPSNLLIRRVHTVARQYPSHE